MINVYCLLTRENKLPFSASFCSKQTDVCCFHFPFASNKQKLQFPSVPFQDIYKENERIYIYMLPFHMENGKKKPRHFSLIHYCLLIVQTEVCRLSVC